MNRRDRLAAVALFVALAIVGAVLVIPGPSSAPSQTPHPSAVNLLYREGVVSHPSSVNPITPRSQADQDLVALLFRGLVKAGPNGTVVSDLATWTSSDDGRSYTFTMREDAYWEDGQPVTSADVVFTVGLVQDPTYSGPLGASWQGVHASADGPSVVHFTMTLPIAGFLRQAELPILPSHLLKGTAVAKLADSDYSARPVGDGLFRIVELDNAHALLERVATVNETPIRTPTPVPSASPSPSQSAFVFATATPRVINVTPSPGPTPSATPTASPTPSASATPAAIPIPSGLTLSQLQRIELVFYSDSASAAADFKAGRLDAVGGLTPDQTDVALTAAGSRQIDYAWSSLLSVVLNQRSDHTEFRDANTRTGLLAAINRQNLLTSVLRGRGSLAELPIPSWSPYYDWTAVTPTPYGFFDAQNFLTNGGWRQSTAGWTAPKQTELYTMDLLTLDEASNPAVYRTAVLVAESWRALGMSVQVEPVPTVTYLTRLDSGDFGAAVVDFEVGLDADLEPMLLSSQVGAGGSNVAGLQDSALDQLLITARKTADPTARQTAMSAVEKYLSATMPILPLAFRNYDLVVSNRVWGMSSNELADPSSRFWDVIDWRLASGR
jgi:ABC-type transport system substrate-binding protein